MLRAERYLFLVLWFSLGLSVAYQETLIDIYPFYLPAFLLCVIFMLRSLRSGYLPGVNSTIALSSGLLLFSILIALPFSHDPLQSLSYTVYLLVCFFLFYYAYNNADWLIEWGLPKSLVVFSVIQGFFSLLQVITGSGIGVVVSYVGEVRDVTRGAIFGLRRAMGTFSNPNTYAQFMGLFSAYALAAYIKKPGFRNMTYVVFCLSCMILTFSTGTWIAVGLLLGATFIYYIWKQRRYSAFYKFLFAALILMIILEIVFGWMGINPFETTLARIERRGEWRSFNVSNRLGSLVDAVQLSTRYVFGTGFEMYHLFAEKSPLIRPHNALLLFLAEVGWLPTLLITWFGWLVFRGTFRLRKLAQISELQLAGLLFLPPLLFFLMVYLTSLQRETLALYMIMYGYVLGTASHKSRTSETTGSGKI